MRRHSTKALDLGISLVLLLLLFRIVSDSQWLSIYSDEIAYRVMNSRTVEDKGVLMSLFPRCEEASTSVVPVTWYLGKIIDFSIFSWVNELPSLRILGILFFLVVLGVLMSLVALTTGPEDSKLKRINFFLSLFLVGAIPYSMIIARPEQIILLSLLLLVFLVLFIAKRNRQLTTPVAACVTFLFCCSFSVMFSNHAKSLFLFPTLFVLLVIFFNYLRSRILKGFLAFLLLFSIFECFQTWNRRLSCKESPAIEDVIRRQGTSPSLLFTDPILFTTKLKENIFAADSYFSHILLNKSYQEDWLGARADKLNIYDEVANSLIFAIFFGIFCVALGIAGWRIWRKDASLLMPKELVFLSLWASMLGMIAFQSSKNFYEAAILFPLFLFSAILLFPSFSRTRLLRWGITFLTVVFCAIGIHSQSFVHEIFQNMPHRTPLPSGIALHSFKNEAQKAEIEKAIDLCHLRDPSLSRIVVDDLTYFHVKSSIQPILITYFLWQMSLENADYLRVRETFESVGSTGILARCSAVPPALRAELIQLGEICCARLNPKQN